MSVGRSVGPSVRRSVGPSVGPSVRNTFVKIAENGVMQDGELGTHLMSCIRPCFSGIEGRRHSIISCSEYQYFSLVFIYAINYYIDGGGRRLTGQNINSPGIYKTKIRIRTGKWEKKGEK